MREARAIQRRTAAWLLACGLAGTACALGPHLPSTAPPPATSSAPAIATSPVPGATPCTVGPGCQPATDPAVEQAVWEVLRPVADELLARLNAERTALGLPPLEPQPGLSRIAFERASDMHARGYLSHQDPADGSVPAQVWMAEAGFGGLLAETLFAAPGGLGELPGSALAGWLGSETNRVVLLAPAFRYAGAGLMGGPEGWTVALVLAESGP